MSESGHPLGASSPTTVLDNSLLDEVDNIMEDLHVGPPGPVSPKTARVCAMAKVAREAARRSEARVKEAERRAAESWDNDLRAAAQLELLQDLRGSSTYPSYPVGGIAGPRPSSVPSPAPVPPPPSPSFSSFLSSAGPMLEMHDLQQEVHCLREAEEERSCGTDLHNPESLHADMAWVEDQGNWGTL